VRFYCSERAAMIYDADGKLGFQMHDMSEEEWARHLGLSRPPVRLISVSMGLPISWFYNS